MTSSSLLTIVVCSLVVGASALKVYKDVVYDHLFRQRKVLKMDETCEANGSERRYQKYCRVEVQAYSGYNSSCHGANEGFVTLNGNTIWSAGWCSELGNSRGVTIINVDAHSCAASAIRRFDTHDSESNAVALATYLQQLPLGTIMVGVTGDEPAAKLGPALGTLKSMNVDVTGLQFRENFAFVLQKGYSFQPLVEKRLGTGAKPAKINIQLDSRNKCRILVQQHAGGTTFFNRTWIEYKGGFGEVTSNYWIGNDKLHELTVDGNYKLRVELLAKFNSQWYWAEYETFRVLDERTGYVLWVDGYSGTAGNGLQSNNGIRFSTKDRDYDTTSIHCAQDVTHGNNAGFWYSSCGAAFINSPIDGSNGFAWFSLPIGSYSYDRKLIISRLFLVLK